MFGTYSSVGLFGHFREHVPCYQDGTQERAAKWRCTYGDGA